MPQVIVAAAGSCGINVRAGVHTGECEVVGDDIAGMAVHIGARIGALAQAGEVYTSGIVKDLVVGSGIEFSERGTRELRGVPGEWPIYRSPRQDTLRDSWHRRYCGPRSNRAT